MSWVHISCHSTLAKRACFAGKTHKIVSCVEWGSQYYGSSGGLQLTEQDCNRSFIMSRKTETRLVQHYALTVMHTGHVVFKKNLPGSLLQSTKVSSDRQFITSCSLALAPVRLPGKVSLATQTASFPPSCWAARSRTKMESPRHCWVLLNC